MRTTNMAKKPMGVSLEPELGDQCRAASWYIGRGVTITSILAAGAEQELARLEQAHGGPFPERKEDVKRQPGTKHRKEDIRETIVIRMEPDLLERLRNAAAFTGQNISNIVTDGAARVLTKLQRQHNDGQPFPAPKKPAV